MPSEGEAAWHSNARSLVEQHRDPARRHQRVFVDLHFVDDFDAEGSLACQPFDAVALTLTSSSFAAISSISNSTFTATRCRAPPSRALAAVGNRCARGRAPGDRPEG